MSEAAVLAAEVEEAKVTLEQKRVAMEQAKAAADAVPATEWKPLYDKFLVLEREHGQAKKALVTANNAVKGFEAKEANRLAAKAEADVKEAEKVRLANEKAEAERLELERSIDTAMQAWSNRKPELESGADAWKAEQLAARRSVLESELSEQEKTSRDRLETQLKETRDRTLAKLAEQEKATRDRLTEQEKSARDKLEKTLAAEATPEGDRDYCVYTYVANDGPFFVGVAKGDEYMTHIKDSRWQRPSGHLCTLYTKLRKMVAIGVLPGVLRLKENLTETEAREFVAYFIRTFNESNIVVYNKTPGGNRGRPKGAKTNG